MTEDQFLRNNKVENARMSMHGHTSRLTSNTIGYTSRISLRFSSAIRANILANFGILTHKQTSFLQIVKTVTETHGIFVLLHEIAAKDSIPPNAIHVRNILTNHAVTDL